MKFLCFIAVLTGLAGSAVANPGHPGSALKSHNKIRNDAKGSAAPGSATDLHEVLLPEGEHAPGVHLLSVKRSWLGNNLNPQDSLSDENSEGLWQGLSATPPNPPEGVDPTKLQVWLRVNTNMWRAKDLENDKGYNHAEFTRLTTDIGGKHADVVIGNKFKNWYQYGMEFAGEDYWPEYSNNCEGHRTVIYNRLLKKKHSHSKWLFKGVIKDPNITNPHSKTLVTIGKSLFCFPYFFMRMALY
ncbi:hypothetical protein PpBr36_08874 [Pyricularia pennisetigena]|uniref:hypothetical protein n=1 Tax=Pyricularia pennisetigena TaxID=1578925 RepID=UPI00114F938F|nr:hypothetical protein PpBr36_08874 [Pyricularia pennisetigena]TLS24828.1 hypothetical protein PpBr36_08874 [Pyricularia pennisetigena]